MNGIQRDLDRAKSQSFDIAIIGGGIYGIMLAYEAVKRGLQCILLEKDDFGQHTTFNWLRILHGGLRYLQTMDLKRFRESVSERSWFIRTFPEHVQILPCLMPLYNRGIRRPDIFRLALKANDFLSRNRNRDISSPHLHLPDGRIVDTRTVRTLFPQVDRHKLCGAALWYDAIVPDSQRLVIDLLKVVCGRTCVALNHVEARRLIVSQDRQVMGIEAFDSISGAPLNITVRRVVNTTGPWCRQVAADFHSDMPDLFHHSIAWNVLFDRPGLSSHALAVSPPKPGGHTYFLLNWKNQLLAGTGHRPWPHPFQPNPMPSETQIAEMIADLNNTVPSLHLHERDIAKTFCGYLPAARPHSAKLANRPIVIDHGDDGGPRGLYSVSGVKFTTSRRVADNILSEIFPGKAPNTADGLDRIPATPEFRLLLRELSDAQPSQSTIHKLLKQLAMTESTIVEDDLIQRRIGCLPPSECKQPVIEQQIASLGFLSKAAVAPGHHSQRSEKQGV